MSDKSILAVDFEYPKNLQDWYMIYHFSQKTCKICHKLECNFHNIEKCREHMRAVKEALNYGLLLKRVHKVLKFNQKAWLKLCTDLNTKLRIKPKSDFENLWG